MRARRGRFRTCFRRRRPGSSRPKASATGRAVLERLNRRHAAQNEGDSRLESRIAAYELAARMQQTAPEALDLAGESAATRALYGLDDPTTADFGRRCLLARRLLERGMRFVQVWSGAGGPKNNWDNHSDIVSELRPMARSVDRPTAGLLTDLKARGLLDDTLVVWSTEFGRQPFTQGATGRDHNGGTSVAWLRRRRQSREAPPTARATPGPGGPPPARPTATTCTRRSFT